MVERLKCGLKAPRVIRGFRNNRVAEGALRSRSPRDHNSTSRMPTCVSEGRRVLSEEARPSAREEAFPLCRPTATRSLPHLIWDICVIRVIRGSTLLEKSGGVRSA